MQAVGSNYWVCPECEGHAINLALLRQRADAAAVIRLWQTARTAGRDSEVRCPACRQGMKEVMFVPKTEPVRIDVCERCQFLWFDGRGLQELPKYSPPAPVKERLPQKAREALAAWEVERIREQAERESAADGELPDEAWKVVAGFLGMPVEHEQDELQRRPIATWVVSGLILLVSCMVFALGREALVALAFIPAEPWRWAGLTWITSFFVHGGIVHLLGNLYFLMVFGDNVEDLIGRKRFLAVLFLGVILGHALHGMFEPQGSLPTIGASGGISAVIALYALAFPKARLGLMMRYQWVHFTARTGFFLWVALQFMGAWLQIAGIGRVSAVAHLGGCLVGVLYWLVFAGTLRKGIVPS